jgi:hypothetical protein
MRRVVPLAPASALLALTCCTSDSSSSDRSIDAVADGADRDAHDAIVIDGASDAGGDAGADAVACRNLPSVSPVPVSGPALAIVGEPGSALGIYDPSLFYPVGAPGGVLSYSTVAPNDVHTRVAVSTDNGATFAYVAEPNRAAPITVDTVDTTACGASTCAGVLWHEVSSIVADPADPDPNRLFKLFTHSYVSTQNGASLHRQWGYIGVQTAPKPEGPWSAEKKAIGWRSDSTFSSAGAAQLAGDIPGIADCAILTEPGALTAADGLYLALACAHVVGAQPQIQVVLLRSTDSAATFRFVSVLVSDADAPCLDGALPHVQGPDLFTAGGKAYVTVTPVGPVTHGLGGDPTGYRGCMTIPIDDLAGGKIARTPTGAPSVARWMRAPDGRFTGPCTYAEGATALGYLVPELNDTAAPFGILRTTLTAP